jgi:hypothetical protein
VLLDSDAGKLIRHSPSRRHDAKPPRSQSTPPVLEGGFDKVRRSRQMSWACVTATG